MNGLGCKIERVLAVIIKSDTTYFTLSSLTLSCAEHIASKKDIF